MAITEADIEHYSGMYLRKAEGFASHTVHADLSPHEDRAGNIDPSYAVETETPFSSPWRVLMIADEPGKLIESNIVLNLNPPSQDRRHFVDQGGEIGVGLVERRRSAQRYVQDRA